MARIDYLGTVYGPYGVTNYSRYPESTHTNIAHVASGWFDLFDITQTVRTNRQNRTRNPDLFAMLYGRPAGTVGIDRGPMIECDDL